jgi:hypothetical protein
MKAKLSIKTRISAVRLNNSYHIKVELENKYYIHNYPFHSLLNAVDFTSKILEVKEIDLLHWKTENSEFDIWEKFLIYNRSKRTKQKRHIFGMDLTRFVICGVLVDLATNMIFSTLICTEISVRCALTRKES